MKGELFILVTNPCLHKNLTLTLAASALYIQHFPVFKICAVCCTCWMLYLNHITFSSLSTCKELYMEQWPHCSFLELGTCTLPYSSPFLSLHLLGWGLYSQQVCWSILNAVINDGFSVGSLFTVQTAFSTELFSYLHLIFWVGYVGYSEHKVYIVHHSISSSIHKCISRPHFDLSLWV